MPAPLFATGPNLLCTLICHEHGKRIDDFHVAELALGLPPAIAAHERQSRDADHDPGGKLRQVIRITDPPTPGSIGLSSNASGLRAPRQGFSPAGLMAAAVVGGLGTGAAQPALMTVAVDQTSPQRRGQSLAPFQCFYDLGIGLGSLTLGTFLDLVDQNFSLMYAVTSMIALAGLWVYWKQSG